MAKPKPDQQCAFEACERSAYCRGLCVRHYEQQNEGKPLTPIRPKRKSQPEQCEVDGCTRRPTRRGMCPMHNHRVDKHGDPGGPDSWWRAACQVEGCVRKHHAHGYCPTHLKRWKLYGDPDGKWAPGRCRTEGCAEPPLSNHSGRGRGLCASCHLGTLVTDYLAGRFRPKPTPSGYVYVSVRKDRFALHRLVMERVLGRPLHPFETPHHRNGIRHDNRPENLELWVTPQPSGQRPEDLAEWVVEHYPDLVEAALARRSGGYL